MWAGQRSNQNPYDEVRAFYVRTADAQMGERLQLDKLRVLEEEKEMRLRTLVSPHLCDPCEVFSCYHFIPS